jgi:hypothetical protein
MINVLRTGEPIKNDLKSQILRRIDKLYGVNSPQIKRQMMLFSKYNFTYTELFDILAFLNKAVTISPDADTKAYDVWFERRARPKLERGEKGL